MEYHPLTLNVRPQEGEGREVNPMTRKIHGLIPVFPVADVDATLAYYRDALGFSCEGRHQDESSEAVFGSALCDGANFYFRKTKGPIPANNCMVYVDEVDEFCATLKARGVKILEEPEDKPWGYRQFTLEDLNGHTLCVFRFSDSVE